jgi:hypothetical protein
MCPYMKENLRPEHLCQVKFFLFTEIIQLSMLYQLPKMCIYIQLDKLYSKIHLGNTDTYEIFQAVIYYSSVKKCTVFQINII